MKTAKTKIIEIYGGFHNQVVPIRVRVPIDYHRATHSLLEVLSVETYQRVNRHICGLKGCMCGGVQRATIDFN